MDISHFHTLYWIRPRNGRLEARALGKFFYDGNRVAKLEDHYGFLGDLPNEGPATPDVKRQLLRLFHGSTHMRVVTKSESAQAPEERAPEASGSVDNGGPQTTVSPRPPAVFDYHRQGMDKPHVLEVSNGTAVLDGNTLSPEETQTVLANVKNRAATLRYRRSSTEPSLAKMEEVMEELAKAEGSIPGQGLSADLEAMRGLVAEGYVPKARYERIRRELFVDDLTGLGNLKAFREHMERVPQGIHALLDLDHLKAINDTHGHDAGDQSISAAGRALRAAIDKTVGDGVVKAHHLHGDEFHLHALNADHAHRVIRQLRHELEDVPPAGGTHRLSMSVGLGQSVPEADKALRGAKGQKAAAIVEAGGDPTDRMAHVRSPHTLHVHSLLSGQEGAVPVAESVPAEVIPSAGAGGDGKTD